MRSWLMSVFCPVGISSWGHWCKGQHRPWISDLYWLLLSGRDQLLKAFFFWAREMVQWLKALAAFLENSGSIPKYPRGSSHPPGTPVPADLMSSSGLPWHYACRWCTDVHTGKVPIKSTLEKKAFSVYHWSVKYFDQEWIFFLFVKTSFY